MYSDYSAPLRRPRGRLWKRDPRSIVLALFASLVGVFLMTGSAYGSTASGPVKVQVQPGDTVWTIAAAHYPSDDIRQRVDDIEALNHLPGAFVAVGQDLYLPE